MVKWSKTKELKKSCPPPLRNDKDHLRHFKRGPQAVVVTSKTRDVRCRVIPVSDDIITKLFLPCSNLDARLADVLSLRRACALL